MSISTPQEQPQEGQDPQDPTVAAPAAPAAPTPAAPAAGGSTPWTQDINAIFADDGVRGQVDQYLREKVQPYTTQLEQKAAQAEQALNLWQALESDPVQTYVQMTQELYGDAAAQKVLDTIQAELQSQEQPVNQPDQSQYATPMDPRMEEALNWYEAQQAEAYYEQEFNRIKEEPQNADILPFIDDIHAFIAAEEGDFDKGAQSLRSFVQKYGTPQTPTEPASEAPAVMGSDTSTAQASSTPVEPRKQTLDQAIEEFVRESRSEPAPPVL